MEAKQRHTAAGGNGNESVDNDGYASYDRVIAVAACNDRGKRSVYSDFGKAIWCAFPSNDIGHLPFQHPEPLTLGIWTTDQSGSRGYNQGIAQSGDVAGDFTNSFGGTSSACPGAAGVAALVLSVHPDLQWQEVRDILRRSCDRIDPQGGLYDNNGHSQYYGYGRLNAENAVKLARPDSRNSSEERGREGLEGLVGLGMTNEEIEVWYELAAVAGRMLQLPELHPWERHEASHDFHKLQDRLLGRPGLRATGWPRQ